MNWAQLEHVIRAAGTIADVDELVVIGSAALLGTLPDPPAALVVRSMEADLYPPAAPHLADLIDGSIGEGSPFHETFGYHAHGVAEETAVLPSGWRARALVRTTPGMQGRRAVFPDIHDLALSKLVAGRAKDRDFVLGLLQAGQVQPATLQQRLLELPVDESRRQSLHEAIEGLTRRAGADAR